MTGKVRISKFQRFSGIVESLVAKSEILLQPIQAQPQTPEKPCHAFVNHWCSACTH